MAVHMHAHIYMQIYTSHMPAHMSITMPILVSAHRTALCVGTNFYKFVFVLLAVRRGTRHVEQTRKHDERQNQAHSQQTAEWMCAWACLKRCVWERTQTRTCHAKS